MPLPDEQIELLDCFERVGISMRPEIDNYFKRFSTEEKNGY